MSDSENDKIDSIFIIPQEEKDLRAKRKAQLEARKQKNKELRAKIARSKAIEKSVEKKTIKNNKSDIENLKEQLRQIRESNKLNTIDENINLSNNNNDLENDKKPIQKTQSNKKEEDSVLESKLPEIKKVEPVKVATVKNAEKLPEPVKKTINPKLFKRRF